MEMPIRGCGLTHPCGDGYGKPPGYWLTLAYSGGCPGRFDVGCQIPMPFSFDIPAAPGDDEVVEIGPTQPNNPTALIAADVSTAVTISQITGPDDKRIGMEGIGISGAGYAIAQFSFEALRSCVNLFPSNVGIIDKTNRLQISVVRETAASVFQGFLVGFAPGLEGVGIAAKMGYCNPRELGYLQQLARWQETGECPGELLGHLEKVVKQQGRLGALMAA